MSEGTHYFDFGNDGITIVVTDGKVIADVYYGDFADHDYYPDPNTGEGQFDSFAEAFAELVVPYYTAKME